MEILNPMVLVPLLVGPIFMIVGLILLKFPPKKINYLYGYRTKNSMKDQGRWDFSQRYSGNDMVKAGGIFTLLVSIGFLVKVNELVGTIIIISLLIIIVIILFFRTENAIKNNFDKI